MIISRSRLTLGLALLAILPILPSKQAHAQVNVWTHRNDNNRTGANLSETRLSAANVNPKQFGKRFSIPVDGYVQAQPLYISHVAIPGKGTHNVLYIATEHNSVYACDADTGAVLWHDGPATIGPAVSSMDIIACDGRSHFQEMGPELGIASTPVIDVAAKTLYCLSQSHVKSSFEPWVQLLHALDITTGRERKGWPVHIPSVVTVPGQSTRTFFLQFQNQRAGLALSGKSVYVAWGSYADCFTSTGGYNGYVMRFSTRPGIAAGSGGVQGRRGHYATPFGAPATKRLEAVYCATPSTPYGMGGIWMTGNAPAVDEKGFVYVSTGNGKSDAGQPHSVNLPDSVLKLDGHSLALHDYFVPANYRDIERGDFDLASAGVMLVPGTKFLIGSAKDGTVYLMNSSDMTKFNPNGDRIIQQFQAASDPMNCMNPDGSIDTNFHSAACNHIMNSPVFYSSPLYGPTVYYSLAGETIKGFHLAGGKFDLKEHSKTGPTQSETPVPARYAGGAAMSISAHGRKPGTGIVWAAMPRDAGVDPAWDPVPGVLRAYDASTLRELWGSDDNQPRDALGIYAKYTPPTIANGKVYAPTFSNKVDVYGLLAAAGRR